jgi:hypothetical protein
MVMKNLPVSFVDCPYTRNITRLKPIAAQKLQCHILALLSVARETIKAEFLTKFGIVFDGWMKKPISSTLALQQLAYLKFGSGGKKEHAQTMLSMNSLLVGGIQGMRAQHHLNHVEKVLESDGKTFNNIVCLVGDNCSVNQCMARFWMFLLSAVRVISLILRFANGFRNKRN